MMYALNSPPQSNSKRGHVAQGRFLRWLINQSWHAAHSIWRGTNHLIRSTPTCGIVRLIRRHLRYQFITNVRPIGHLRYARWMTARGITVLDVQLVWYGKVFFNSSRHKVSDRPKGHPCPEFPTSSLPDERGHIVLGTQCPSPAKVPLKAMRQCHRLLKP